MTARRSASTGTGATCRSCAGTSRSGHTSPIAKYSGRACTTIGTGTRRASSEYRPRAPMQPSMRNIGFLLPRPRRPHSFSRYFPVVRGDPEMLKKKSGDPWTGKPLPEGLMELSEDESRTPIWRALDARYDQVRSSVVHWDGCCKSCRWRSTEFCGKSCRRRSMLGSQVGWNCLQKKYAAPLRVVRRELRLSPRTRYAK